MRKASQRRLPDLYIHIGRATHFLQWELPEFRKYFNIVHKPNPSVPLLSFGPDILVEASRLPASKRFAVTFPGFGQNPLYNDEVKKAHIEVLSKRFAKVFINYGPLEIAYMELNNVVIYPFSVDINSVTLSRYRTELSSLLHVSNDGPQKDWRRSEAIMKATKLKYEIFPPRQDDILARQVKINIRKNKIRKALLLQEKKYLPYGYVNHKAVVKKYQQYDGFVHVAKDIKHPKVIDGKYTASLIEAGVTGAILFWHDTFNLGNNLHTVFELPLAPKSAAEKILEIRSSIDIEKHSRLTREEMLDTFNPADSVKVRSNVILSELEG